MADLPETLFAGVSKLSEDELEALQVHVSLQVTKARIQGAWVPLTVVGGLGTAGVWLGGLFLAASDFGLDPGNVIRALLFASAMSIFPAILTSVAYSKGWSP